MGQTNRFGNMRRRVAKQFKIAHWRIVIVAARNKTVLGLPKLLTQALARLLAAFSPESRTEWRFTLNMPVYLAQPQHQIDILQRRTAGTLAQIIQPRNQHCLLRRRVFKHE